MAKKNFTNPAMQFLTPAAAEVETPSAQPQTVAQDAPAAKPKAGTPAKAPRLRAIESAEPRTRRLNLLVKPSIYKNLRKMAWRDRTSINHEIEIILEKCIADWQAEKADAEAETAREGK